MKSFLLSLLLLISTLFATSQTYANEPERPEVAKYVSVYESATGISVSIVRIGAPEKAEALLQIVGIDHTWDGKIFKVQVRSTKTRNIYFVDQKGQEFQIALINDGYGSLHLPDLNKEIALHYAKDLSRSANSEHFLTAYLNQLEQ